MKGLYLKVGSLKSSPTDCNSLKQFDVQLFYILLKLNNQDAAWTSFFKNCSSQKHSALQVIDELISTKKMSNNQITTFVNQFQLSSEIRTEILKKVSKRNKTQFDEPLKNIHGIILDTKKHSKSSDLYFENKKLLKAIEKLPVFYQRFFTPYVAIRAKNKSWFFSSMENLISTDPRRLYFEGLWSSLDDQQHENLDRVFKVVVQTYLKEIEESYLEKSFIAFIHNFEEIEEKKLGSIPDKATISGIRDNLKEYAKTKRNFTIWLQELYLNGTTKEFVDYYNSFTDLEKLEHLEVDDFQIFEYKWPTNEIKREVLVNKLSVKLKAQDLYTRFVLYSLLKQQRVRASFTQVNKKMDVPFFSLNRRFYKEAAIIGHDKYYSIYELIKAGDWNSIYLWWLVL